MTKLFGEAMMRNRVWIFFGGVVAVLLGSAFVGTQPVRAQAACTTQQCSVAQNYAEHVCLSRNRGLANFLCPTPAPENDDFFFTCTDNYFERLDCSNDNPS